MRQEKNRANTSVFFIMFSTLAQKYSQKKTYLVGILTKTMLNLVGILTKIEDIMKRAIYTQLLEWKSDPERKPLLLRGARQVGKTHLVRTFGNEFEDFIELNLEESESLRSIFDADLDPAHILRRLSLILERPIVPGKTLLFLDEIQTAPRGITALRYFYEKMPELHVIAAGSLI